MATARILVVDDEPVFLGAVAKNLSRRGYDVRAANRPSAALELVRHDGFACDVVLSDLDMPEMRGTDLVREITQLLPQTACLIMTGKAFDTADVPASVQVLRKPFLTVDLIAAVQLALSRSAELSPKLQESIERSAELHDESARLIAQC